MSTRQGEQFDPYRILGVPVGASKQQIRRQYRRLVRRLHPDLRRDDPTAHEEMVRINRAYQVLMDDRLRAQWEARAAEEIIGPLRVEQSTEAAVARARRLLEAGRLEEAKLACADALDADPKCAEAFALLGQIYMREGLDHLAREMFRQAERLARPRDKTAPPGAPAEAARQQPPRGPRELWVPEPVRVNWTAAVAGVLVAAAVVVVAGKSQGPAASPIKLLAGVAAGSFVALFALAVAGAVEPADAVLGEPVWGAYGRGAPLWLVILVAGAVWGHLALIFYLVVGYLNECLHASAGIFFLAAYAALALATAVAPAAAAIVWLAGANGAVVGGVVGWMIGSIFSPHEWWRTGP